MSKLNGAICGGVISSSMFRNMMKKNIYAGMMAFIIPDKQYIRFITLKKQNKNRETQKIFDRYAISQI